MQIAPIVALGAFVNGWEQLFDFPFYDTFLKMMPRLSGGWFPIPDYGVSNPRLSDPSEAAAMLYKILVDFLANGFRIAIAIAFLASFLFRPLIQGPISWLWLRTVESTLPFFTLAFGITGGVVKFGYALMS